MFRRIQQILCDVPEYEENHHMGRPFLSAYQIALEYSRRFENDPDVVRLPLGGAGTGTNQSLTQFIALFLSREIQKLGNQSPIEGRFIAHQDLIAMRFTGNLDVSTIDSKPSHSIFRCLNCEEISEES